MAPWNVRPRATTASTTQKFEVSGHKWPTSPTTAANSAPGILNDSKYGWDAIQLKDEEGNVEATRLRLTALRSPMGAPVRCSGWDPSPYYIDKTTHDFTYSSIRTPAPGRRQTPCRRPPS